MVNKYMNHAKDIRDISIKNGVDIGVALDMFCAAQGIKYAPHDAEQREFLDICRKTPLDKLI